MSKNVYLPYHVTSGNAHIRSMEQYREMHKRSVDLPASFWSEIADQFHWETPYDIDNFYSFNFDMTRGPVQVKWMEGATTNVCYNLLDKNVRNGMSDKVAFYWLVGRNKCVSHSLSSRQSINWSDYAFVYWLINALIQSYSCTFIIYGSILFLNPYRK